MRVGESGREWVRVGGCLGACEFARMGVAVVGSGSAVDARLTTIDKRLTRHAHPTLRYTPCAQRTTPGVSGQPSTRVAVDFVERR